MSQVNPATALLILEKITELNEGDLILQNAGNSALGICIAQLAAYKGLRCINTVRREGLIPQMREAGCLDTCLDNDSLPDFIQDTFGGQKPRLAINTIGGNSAIRQIKSLADEGIQVTLGGMTGEPVRFPTRYLIFNNVQHEASGLTYGLETIPMNYQL